MRTFPYFLYFADDLMEIRACHQFQLGKMPGNFENQLSNLKPCSTARTMTDKHVAQQFPSPTMWKRNKQQQKQNEKEHYDTIGERKSECETSGNIISLCNNYIRNWNWNRWRIRFCAANPISFVLLVHVCMNNDNNNNNENDDKNELSNFLNEQNEQNVSDKTCVI